MNIQIKEAAWKNMIFLPKQNVTRRSKDLGKGRTVDVKHGLEVGNNGDCMELI